MYFHGLFLTSMKKKLKNRSHFQATNGDGARRSIKEVLEQLLTILRVKKAVQSNGNMISLRFAADGRRTSNKIGTVKAEFSLIEEKENDCDHQYCVALCNSKLYLSFVDCKGAGVTCITDAYLYIKQTAKMT